MRQVSERLNEAVPTEGGFDLTFSIGQGTTRDTVQATLNLTLFKKPEEGKAPQIQRRVTVAGIAADAKLAQNEALEFALELLGV